MHSAALILSWTSAGCALAGVAFSAVGGPSVFWLIPCGIAAGLAVYCERRTEL